MKSSAPETYASAKNIAVLTDFSPCSSSALQLAIRLAGHSNAKVFLIHAIEPWRFAYFPCEIEALQELHSRARLNMLRELAKFGAVRHELIVEEGKPGEVLRRISAARQIGLIALGTIGIGRFHDDEVLGSTAQNITSQAPCPVLSIGSEVQIRDSFPAVAQILCPLDVSGDLTSAAYYAASIARRYQARLSLLQVVAAPLPFDSTEDKLMKETYRGGLAGLIRGGAGLEYPADCQVEFDDCPADAIVRVAAQISADLIVTGRTSRASGNGRRPSVRVLVQSPCPVLTVPEFGAEMADNVAPQQEGLYMEQRASRMPSAYTV